eukprot:3824020-Pyramimonas_sp.AAC.1
MPMPTLSTIWARPSRPCTIARLTGKVSLFPSWATRGLEICWSGPKPLVTSAAILWQVDTFRSGRPILESSFAGWGPRWLRLRASPGLTGP